MIILAATDTKRGRLASLLMASLVLFGAAAPLRAQKPLTPLAPGLVATATDGERKAVFLTPTPNFTLTPQQSIHPQLKPEFKVEWTGVLNILRAGQYTFSADTKLWLDGKEAQGLPVQLTAGEHTLRLAFERKPGTNARVQLVWQSDFFPPEPVPASVLAHRGEPNDMARLAKLARGRELIEELNCAACHRPESGAIGRRAAPNLSGIGSRVTAAWLAKWIENPQHVRTNTPMPAMQGMPPDRADVVAYLVELKDAESLKDPVADAARLEAGRVLFDTIGCLACHGTNGVTLAGLGSKWTSTGQLAKYLLDPLAADPSGRMPNLGLKRDETEALAAFLMKSTSLGFEPPVLPGHTGIPLRGKVLVQASGCLNCHTLKEGTAVLNSFVRAPLMKDLLPNKGCLSGRPPPNTPRFNLSVEDRASLAAFLQSPDVSPAPVQDFQRMVKQFHCAECHELNGAATLSFEANQAPPPLTDTGNKLRASWLTEVLLNQKRVRPWMTLRMPHFGPAVQPLVHHFAAQAGAEPGEGEKPARPNAQQVADGIKLLGKGDGGLACITCHDFNGERSTGDLRGPDMTEMSARIRNDWLRRWLREPSRLQPGTAMPAFFSEMQPAQAEPTIARLVQVLAGGKSLPLPEGLLTAPQDYRMLVKSEPIVFRTFIADSPSRSIAIGLPGGQSFVFDAENCRLRYAWSGDFLDVQAVWSGRGGGLAKILGARYYTAPDAQPLRLGTADTVPQTVRFRGYRLVNNAPELHYELDGITVKERITVATGGKGLTRAFELANVDQELWFVPDPHPGVSISVAPAESSQGRFKIPAGRNPRFTVTIQLE